MTVHVTGGSMEYGALGWIDTLSGIFEVLTWPLALQLAQETGSWDLADWFRSFVQRGH